MRLELLRAKIRVFFWALTVPRVGPRMPQKLDEDWPPACNFLVGESPGSPGWRQKMYLFWSRWVHWIESVHWGLTARLSNARGQKEHASPLFILHMQSSSKLFSSTSKAYPDPGLTLPASAILLLHCANGALMSPCSALVSWEPLPHTQKEGDAENVDTLLSKL